jgi:hypothetical protein
MEEKSCVGMAELYTDLQIIQTALCKIHKVTN